LIAISLEEGDELGWVRLTSGEDEIILVTEQGQALRFSEATVRPMGRGAGGVNGIALQGGDLVASMEVVEAGADLLVVTALGYAKRTPLADYPAKGRATGGVVTLDPKALTTVGLIAAARVVQPVDDLTVISSNGVVLRTKVADVRPAGRATRGVLLMAVEKGDRVASLARIAQADLKRVGVDS
jgi:DNA gyrase subunit A